jgi:ketosteroid isomerase-like protein
VSDSEQEIRDLIHRWAAAVHAGDLEAVLADHTEDIVMFDVPPPDDGVRGLDAYRETWPPFFEWQRSGASFEIVSLDVTPGEDVAFAWGPVALRNRRRAAEGSQQPPPPDHRIAQGRPKVGRRSRTSFVPRQELRVRQRGGFQDVSAAADGRASWLIGGGLTHLGPTTARARRWRPGRRCCSSLSGPVAAASSRSRPGTAAFRSPGRWG